MRKILIIPIALVLILLFVTLFYYNESDLKFPKILNWERKEGVSSWSKKYGISAWKTTTTESSDEPKSPCEQIYETFKDGFYRYRFGRDWCYRDKDQTTEICISKKC